MSVISSSPRAEGFEVRRDVEHEIVVEIKPRNCVARFRLRGLFLEAHHAAGSIELGHAVALGIGDRISEYRRAVGARARAPELGRESWP